MESTDSSTALLHPQLPPGFRFHPTDEELVVHYLKRKVASAPLPVTIIADIDLYNFDPWELPSKANFGEQEWYFFSPRRRKYPNGARPNRAATSGYWKATGTDKPIVTSIGNQKVGVKKALVFYGGKPPKGIKTNWIMHEYRLVDSNSTAKCQTAADAANRKDSLRLDDWVLCRIYKKNNSQASMVIDKDYSLEGMLTTVLPTSIHQNLKLPSTSRAVTYGSFLENEDNFFEGILTGDQMAVAACNSSSKQNLSMTLANSSSTTTTTNTIFPVKLQYWNTTNSTGSGSCSQSEKRFHGDLKSSTTAGNGIDENNSFVSLINQLPQNAPFYPASLGDRQQFILPNMNWNT